LVVRESYWKDGNVKKRQHHILSFSGWDLYFEGSDADDENTYGHPGPILWFSERLEKILPDLSAGEYENLCRNACEKLTKLRDQITVERDEYQRRERERYRREWASRGNPHFGAGNDHAAPHPESLTDIEKAVLKKAYRLLAQKLHPDHGGDPEEMKALNSAVGKILRK
jgi:hypothetical protein